MDSAEQIPPVASDVEKDRDPAVRFDRLADTGAIVFDNACRVLAWNPLAAALFEDFSALKGR